MKRPALDMYIDIHAEGDAEAIDKVDTLTREILNDCAAKLQAIGFAEGGCQEATITDCGWGEGEEEDEGEWYRGDNEDNW